MSSQQPQRTNRRQRKLQRKLQREGRCERRCKAFTLLEVILALGILAAAIAVVGEVTRLAHRNAERAAMEGDALLIAESVMNQLTAGLLEPVDVPPTEWIEASGANANPVWRYSLTVLPTELEELLQTQVLVEQISTTEAKGMSVSLIRWIADPNLTSAEGDS